MLAWIDRILAPLTWAAAVFTVVVLIAGPQLIGADADEEGDAAPAATATATPSEAGTPAATETASPAADGAKVFADAGCGDCHTLAAANASGAVGPNLDDLGPDAASVETVVENGSGSMPAFSDRLSPEEIKAVAQYVADNAGQ
jgi:mono/diheme cytochrome c family protein